MRLRLYVKYMFVLLLSAYAPMAGAASKAWHYLGIGIGGGEANNVLPKSSISPKAGGAGNLSLLYEAHIGQFIIGFGAEAQYQYTRDAVSDFTDDFNLVDREGEPVLYGYCYSDMMGTAHDVRITAPLYVGGEFGAAYLLLGGKVSYALWTQSQTDTRMLTQGTYAWSIEPTRSVGINDFTPLGYYPQGKYTGRGAYKEQLWAAASVEIGAYLPTDGAYINKVRVRAGVYADYAFRIGTMGGKPLADYSRVDANPQTRNREDLQRNLQLNPVLNSALMGSAAHNVEVGIRLTVLFDVSTSVTPCHCVNN